MKFAITLLSIVLLAVVTFFFGWVELALPAGTHGMVFTKSGGWDKSAIVPGGVTWRWERLIPTNMTLYAFDLTPQIVERVVSGSLPSAERYAAEIDVDLNDFKYEIGLNCQLRLRAEYLPRIVAESDLRPDTLFAWYQQAAASATDAAVTALFSGKMTALLLSPETIGEQVRHWIATRHPALEIIAIDLTSSSIPDHDLYLHAKETFTSRINSQQRARLEAMDDLAQAREQAYQHSEVLRMLGEALKEFPQLVELLSRSDARLLNQVLGVAEGPSP